MTLKSTFYRRLRESAAPQIEVKPDPVNGGIKLTNWFWASARGRTRNAREANEIVAPTAPAKTPEDAAKTPEQQLNDIVLENPQISGAALITSMQTRGLKVVSALESFRQRMPKGLQFRESTKMDDSKKVPKIGIFGRGGKFPKTKETKEADSGSTFPQVTRESAESEFQTFSVKLRESSSDDGIGPTIFEAELLIEGMGNLKDGFYYDRAALESAIPIFTGAKIYADHPSMDEEETRPERSVRDVLGHFENLSIKMLKDERATLSGEVHILPDKPFEWARALVRRSLENAKKFPDKPFVGLSINAAGASVEVPIDEVLRLAPQGAKVKIQLAKEKGIETVKVIRQIRRAVSCDLVTEAGAGGKFINFIERT